MRLLCERKNRSKLTTLYIAGYAAREVGHIKKAMHYEMACWKEKKNIQKSKLITPLPVMRPQRGSGWLAVTLYIGGYGVGPPSGGVFYIIIVPHNVKHLQ